MFYDDKRNFRLNRSTSCWLRSCVSAFALECHVLSIVLSSHVSPFCRAFGVGGTPLFMCEFMQRELGFVPFGLRSTFSGVESKFGLRQERFQLNAANATPSVSVHSLSTKLARSRWSLSLSFFRPLVRRNNNKTTL